MSKTKEQQIAHYQQILNQTKVVVHAKEKQLPPSLSAMLLKKASVIVFGKVVMQAIGTVMALDFGHSVDVIEDALKEISEISIEDIDRIFNDSMNEFLGELFEEVPEPIEYINWTKEDEYKFDAEVLDLTDDDIEDSELDILDFD